MGHRAAPLGNVEAIASKVASARAMRIIVENVIQAKR
jgi:hypothetical protein